MFGLIGLKLKLLHVGIRVVARLGNRIINKQPNEELKDIAVEVAKREVTDLLKILPNVVTDEARRREQSRRAKEVE